MPREDGQFKKGNCANPGGRPKKPDWIKGKGEEALKVVYDIMIDERAPIPNRLAAAKIIIEQDLGKPRQQVENTNFNYESEPMMSLEESLKYLRELMNDVDNTGGCDSTVCS